jgi:hypothetical protein
VPSIQGASGGGGWSTPGNVEVFPRLQASYRKNPIKRAGIVFWQLTAKGTRNMKDVLLLIGVFAVGYLLTMGLLFALVKLFFPFKSVEKEGTSTISFSKTSRHPNKSLARLRKVKLANG